METDLYRRIQVGEMERAVKEKRERVASLRARAIQLLETRGKQKDTTSNPELLPLFFDGSFTFDNTRVRFLVQADNSNPQDADKIAISFPVLYETLYIDSDGKCDIKVDTELSPGRVTSTISHASHIQIKEYSDLLGLIESKFQPSTQSGTTQG